MKSILNILLYIWQLPQNLAGLVLRLIYWKSEKTSVGEIQVYYNKRFPGGISLGKTIMMGNRNILTARHESGHQKQSQRLGPLYLFVIGIPSAIWAGLYGTLVKPEKNKYYKFYTERWADRLGGVRRI